MKRDRTLLNVGIFTVAMLLVAAMLVVVFGQFRFASETDYHATFLDASRLKGGQDVRIAGVPYLVERVGYDLPKDKIERVWIVLRPA